MANFAIIHEATRVVRGLTTDSNYAPMYSDIISPVVDDFDLTGGPWKIDDLGNKSLATPEEIAEAYPLGSPLSLDT